jgi:ferritin-like metal-binding protein YciE
MKLNSLHELLVSELHDLLSAERQLIKIFPKVIKSASHVELRDALQEHLHETTKQEQRLEQCFQKLGIPAKPGRSHGMVGLISAWMELEAAEALPDVRDAAIIASVQRMEHYEIAGYGCAHAFALVLEENEVAALLQDTLKEEEEFDRNLTHLAQTVINTEAELHSR